MALGALELADRLAVPIEPEPFEPVENRLDRRLRRPFAVGVLDAQQELAAEALGVEPVEQRRARAADMQEAGRRGREAGDDLRHFIELEARDLIERVALAEAGVRAKASLSGPLAHFPAAVAVLALPHRQSQAARRAHGLRLHDEVQSVPLPQELRATEARRRFVAPIMH